MRNSNQQWSVVSDPWSVVRCRQLIAGRRRALTTDRWPQTPRAFTLVELLIVVLIVTTVTIATIPLLKPALDSRRIREAARIVSTQFASAQSEAIASGHSVGVWLEKLHQGGASGSVEGDASMEMYLCEQPQPYSGDSTDATCQVSLVPPELAASQTLFTDSAGIKVSINIYFAANFTPAGIVRKGDQIVFNYHGTAYTIDGPDSDGDGYIDNVSPTTPVTAHAILQDYGLSGFPQYPAKSAAIPYEILRQPVKSGNTPVQLPSGAIIDLFYSGMGNSGLLAKAAFSFTAQPVVVMFDRTGALDRVYLASGTFQVRLPLYFLIGKREKAPSVESDITKQNLSDLENIWVSINPQSGLFSTAEVASGNDIISSRAFATAAQTMGGK